MKRFDAMTGPLSGSCLIEASAGTGKTYAIAWLYLRLLIERRLEVRQILVVTFTTAATAELRDRIRLLVRRAADLYAGVMPDERNDDEMKTFGKFRRPSAIPEAEASGTSRCSGTRCASSTRRASTPSTASASECSPSSRSRAGRSSIPSSPPTSRKCSAGRWRTTGASARSRCLNTACADAREGEGPQ